MNSSRFLNLLMRVSMTALAFVAPVIILRLQPTPVTAPGFYDVYRVGAWAACLAGLLGLLALCGFETRHRAWGALIDERNRYSLSRLQMSLWTLLVLGSLYVVLMANAVRGGPHFDALQVDIDANLVLLMGFSVASFVAAPLALTRKADQTASAQELEEAGHKLMPAQRLSQPPAAVGRLLVKRTPADARLADLIRGEDVGSASVVDLPRVQMLLMTLVVVLAYGAAICARLGQGDWLLARLPDLSQTLLLLVLVSHGGYLAGKLAPAPTRSSGPAAQQMSRALLASQRAGELVNELRTTLALTRVDDPRHPALEANLTLAQALAGDAAQLPARTAAADFTTDEISNVEGRTEGLQTSTRLLTQGSGGLGDVPAPETVAKVQRRLQAQGFGVRETGTPDADTEAAITAWLSRAGASRSSLHPSRMRQFEELAQLI